MGTFFLAYGVLIVVQLTFRSVHFTAGDDPWVTIGYVALAFGAGFAIARWWAPLLATSLPLVALIAPEGRDVGSGIVLLAVLGAAATALLLGGGVGGANPGPSIARPSFVRGNPLELIEIPQAETTTPTKRARDCVDLAAAP